MSFNYPSIGNNGMPQMLPLLANMANGTNFIPPLTTSQSISTSGILTTHHHTPFNDAPLEFNNKKKTQPPGAGPMNLESADDEHENHFALQNDTDLTAVNSTNLRKASDHRRLDDVTSSSANESKEKSFSAIANSFNQCDLMFNGMMAMPSQSLMMMPNVMNMVDASSMMSMQTMPPYSLINHIATIQSPSSTTIADSATTTVTASSTSSVAKETITCNSCVLLPPNPNAPPPTTRERPSGCRTVFVGGLPENITEEIIREVFERCGEITTLRLSKKNFCHIRFAFEPSVDSAIYLSGYRIRINNLKDSANCNRLHVDYAQARDDQYEWECKQRQLQREQRHRERIERDRLRPLSPPQVVHFTDHEAASVSEKLKQEDTFSKAVQILSTWLERGDCNKKNANIFYSMIQSTNSHVRRFINEKNNYEEELQKAKDLYKQQMHSLSVQFGQIEKVFGAASHKKVWDHFTKAQRKNIDMWKKQSMELHMATQCEDARDTDEMDMSDDEQEHLRYGKRLRTESKESESLKSDSSVYQIDFNSNKSSLELRHDVKEQQLKVLQETIRNLQTQLLDNKLKEKENLSKISELEKRLKQANVKELLLKTKIVEVSKQASIKTSDTDDNDDDIVCVEDDDDEKDNISKGKILNSASTTALITSPPKPQSNKTNQNRGIDIDEARLIGLVSTFLIVHPFGASLDYIYSYVQRVATQLRPKELEEILCRYTSIFREEVTGVGAKIERKWKFIGFEIDPVAVAIKSD